MHFKRERKLSNILLASTAMLSVAAYSAGATAQTPGGVDPNVFRTADYLNSTGLDQIRAAEAYAIIENQLGIQGGEGVTIAIIDDGIDESHGDIAPNVVDSFIFTGTVNRDADHGTATAGIAAGAGGNGGIQGVAFNANILGIQATLQETPTSEPILDLAENGAIALDTAIANGAEIVNISLGRGTSGPILRNDGTITGTGSTLVGTPLETSMLNAVQAGALVVISAGNDLGELPGLEIDNGLAPGTLVDLGANYPAQFASDPLMADGIIAVMAVDANNQRASFSNSCLGVEARCLAAPGVDFQGAQPGGGVGDIGNGTSYSAPLVSGAAAVVQAAFGVTPQEAGTRLLTTATDLGEVGVDSIFGNGLLNLENALTPQGALTVATTNSADGPKVALSESTFALGSSLALNGDGVNLLGKAVSLDDDNFPFPIDLSQSAQVRSRTTGLDAFIGSDDRKTSVVATETTAVAFSLAEQPELSDPYRAEFAKSETALKKEEALPSMQLQSELTEGVDLFLAFNGSSTSSSSLVSSLPEAGDFFQASTFLSPFDQIAGAQSGGGTSFELGENTDIAVSAFSSSNDDSDRQSVMQKLELTHKTVGDIELRLGYGFMQEDGGFLGGEAKGAFGGESGGNSQYIDLSVLAPVTEKVSLFGAYSRGNTDACAGSNSLLSNYSTLRSEAFGAGLVMTDVAEDGDGFSVMVGQPLRVTEGTADVTVPVGRNEDGTVVQQRAGLDLAPDGREIAFEAVYNFALDGDDQALSAGSFLRLNPDHDTNADPDIGFGINYKIKF